MPDEKKPVQPHAIIHGVPKHPEAVTVPVPAIPGPLAAMLKEIQDGVRSGFERTNANLDTLSHSFDGLQDRVARLEEREAKNRTGPHPRVALGIDGPQKTTSGEVRRISENDLKQDSVIAQLLIQQTETNTKVDSLVTTQTEQTKKLQTLDQTVAKTDARKMEILEDVHKRAVSFLDSPLFKLGKTVAYFALAAAAIKYGVKIGP